MSGPEDTDAPGPASWEDLVSRLLRMPDTRRPVYRVDIGKLMSADARGLLIEAARRATALGDVDIDTDHLLWAGLHRDGLRSLLQRAGADPDALLAQLERDAHAARTESKAPAMPHG